MNPVINLTRVDKVATGIFSRLSIAQTTFMGFSLEHAYQDASSGLWLPKIPDGTFQCQRGTHQLKDGKTPFETFEILGVPGHSGLLFHPGNVDGDSEGCVLPGLQWTPKVAVLQSRAAFAAFMWALRGQNTVSLVVA